MVVYIKRPSSNLPVHRYFILCIKSGESGNIHDRIKNIDTLLHLNSGEPETDFHPFRALKYPYIRVLPITPGTDDYGPLLVVFLIV